MVAIFNSETYKCACGLRDAVIISYSTCNLRPLPGLVVFLTIKGVLPRPHPYHTLTSNPSDMPSTELVVLSLTGLMRRYQEVRVIAVDTCMGRWTHMWTLTNPWYSIRLGLLCCEWAGSIMCGLIVHDCINDIFCNPNLWTAITIFLVMLLKLFSESLQKILSDGMFSSILTFPPPIYSPRFFVKISLKNDLWFLIHHMEELTLSYQKNIKLSKLDYPKPSYGRSKNITSLYTQRKKTCWFSTENRAKRMSPVLARLHMC